MAKKDDYVAVRVEKGQNGRGGVWVVHHSLTWAERLRALVHGDRHQMEICFTGGPPIPADVVDALMEHELQIGFYDASGARLPIDALSEVTRRAVPFDIACVLVSKDVDHTKLTITKGGNGQAITFGGPMPPWCDECGGTGRCSGDVECEACCGMGRTVPVTDDDEAT